MSTYRETNGKSIEEAFKELDRLNPNVYSSFKQQVLLAKAKGKDRVSAKTILGYIRWEIFLTINTTEEFKINDAFTAHYARKFLADFPAYEGIFELRKLR